MYVLNNTKLHLFKTISEDTIDDSGFDYQNVNVGMASFWAVVAGISFSGCRILMQNLKLNTIEVTLVGAFVQIVLSGIFVSFCQCHRLWPSSPAGKKYVCLFWPF